MTALLSIGELASRTGLPVRTIRFYSDAGVVPETPAEQPFYLQLDYNAPHDDGRPPSGPAPPARLKYLSHRVRQNFRLHDEPRRTCPDVRRPNRAVARVAGFDDDPGE